MAPEFPGCILDTTLAEDARFALYRGRLEDGTHVLCEATRARTRSEERARLRRAYGIVKDLGAAVVPRAIGIVEHGDICGLLREDPGGRTLADLLAEKRLRVDSALHIAAALARALSVLASQGIVHRNIAPANILVREDDQAVFLLHFTSAARIGEETLRTPNPEAPEGTLAYMPPEQTGRTNRPVDHRADLYALGAVLYEMLTGTPPFKAQDPIALLHAHLARAPKPPHESDPSVPITVSRVVLKLLAKSADERYQSARGLVADLETCIARLNHVGRIDPFPLGGQDRPTMLASSVRLFGRDAEREALGSAIDRARRGGRELFAIQGAAGMGKSALVSDAASRIGTDDAYFAPGKFDQIGQSLPFAGLGHALGELIRAALAEPEAELNRLRSELEGALGPNAELMARVVPEVALLFGPAENAPELGPIESQNRFALVVQRFLGVFTKRRPVILFLDDLQWADPASLKLVRDVLSDTQSSHLLVISAYRGAEEGAGFHAVRRTIDELDWQGVPVTKVELRPLRPSDVRGLVAGLLGCDASDVESLGVLLWSKTSGNPFFIRQLLGTLVRDGLVEVDPATGGVICDESRIEETVTDDIVTLLVSKIKDLEPTARRALVLAACFGHELDIEALSALCERTPTETRQDLSAAMREGLILPVRPRHLMPRFGEARSAAPRAYRFSHDKVQQAAYSLLAPEEVPTLHLAIARRLREVAGTEGEGLFELLFHASRGASAITDPAERREIARLALDAGQQAKGAAAYEAAATYFGTGLRLLEDDGNGKDDGWQEQPFLMFALTRDRAACLYLTGHFEESEALFHELGKRARTPLERASIHDLQSVLYLSQGRFDESVRLGREALSLLGEPLENDPGMPELAREQAFIDAFFASKPVEAIIQAESPDDPQKRAVMRTLMHLVPAAFAANPNLLFFVCAKMVRATLMWGPTEESAFAFASHGIGLVAMRRYDEAFRMGEIALRLHERMPSPAIACKVYLACGANLHFYRRPLAASLPYLERARREGLATGDLPFLSYTLIQTTMIRLGLGEDLLHVEQEAEAAQQILHKTHDLVSEGTMRVCIQLIRALRGRTRGRTSLADRDFEDTAFLTAMHEKRLLSAVCRYHAARLELSLLLREPLAAEAAADEAEALSATSVSTYFTTEIVYHGALVSASLLRQGGSEEQARREATLERRQTLLSELAEAAPQNFRHKLDLVRAERARATGRDTEAIDLYEAAIEGAAEHGFIKDLALACELAAEHHLAKGRRRVARAYVLDARKAYQRWGAKAKVDDLSIRYEGLWENETPPWDLPAHSSTGDKSLATLDTATVIRAAQAIAGEILLERVLLRVIRAVVESAGADRGMLLIERSGRLWIEATMELEPERLVAGPSMLAEESEELPIAIIDYVRRTREPLLLGDARADRRFAKDKYMLSRAPRSVLCTPMLHKGRLVGVIYLEHATATEAFVAARLTLVDFLAAQAAAAVESALLYAEVQRVTEELLRSNEGLEEEVARRTREARETADKLRIELEQRELAELERETLQAHIIAAQRQRLAELSTPIIPITDRVLVMPLIGVMDEARAAEVMDAALEGASKRSAKVVILDVTGIKGGDSAIADTLVRTAAALKLLGTTAVLTGMRADVARTLVSSAGELSGLITKGSLQAGIAYAIGSKMRG